MALAGKTNVVIAGDNWCPINCAQNSENKGFMIDVATQVFSDLGYQVKYIEMPWSRAVDLARKGEIDAVVGAFKGDAPDFIFPQRPLLKVSSNSFFTKTASNWQYKNLTSLYPITLGTIKGYDYGDELNSYIDRFSEVKNDKLVMLHGNDAVKRNIQLLLRDRIDVFVESAPVFWYQAKLLGVAGQVKQLNSMSKAEPCYIAFSPNNINSSKLATMLDEGILRLQAQGIIKASAQLYGLPPSSYQ